LPGSPPMVPRMPDIDLISVIENSDFSGKLMIVLN
jgi:hypothetical protein